MLVRNGERYLQNLRTINDVRVPPKCIKYTKMRPKTISPVFWTFYGVISSRPILYILNSLLNFGKERLNITKLTIKQY